MPDRNVVLVTVDSIRADHYRPADGAGRMPHLEAMADAGLSFETAIAPGPTTGDSMPAVLTGELVPDRDASKVTKLREHMRARTTIAERFSELGYETGGFTTNPWTSRYFGFQRGFDHFEDFFDERASTSLVERVSSATNSPVVDLARNMLDWAQGQSMFMQWEAFYDDIVAWTEQASEPYFLWVFLVDAHSPFLPPKAYRTQSLTSLYAANAWLFAGAPKRFESRFHDTLVTAYDNCLEYTDDFLERLDGDLAGDDPLIAVHGDHGEEFGEHGQYGHGQALYEELVHVPFVVANGPQDTVEAPTSLARIPELLPALATGEYPDVTAPYVKTRNYNPKFALRGDGWKYIANEDGTHELYDLAAGERREAQLDDSDLAELGAALVDRWDRTDAERADVLQVTDELARAGSV
jgi:arylsulfatase